MEMNFSSISSSAEGPKLFEIAGRGPESD